MGNDMDKMVKDRWDIWVHQQHRLHNLMAPRQGTRDNSGFKVYRLVRATGTAIVYTGSPRKTAKRRWATGTAKDSTAGHGKRHEAMDTATGCPAHWRTGTTGGRARASAATGMNANNTGV